MRDARNELIALVIVQAICIALSVVVLFSDQPGAVAGPIGFLIWLSFPVYKRWKLLKGR